MRSPNSQECIYFGRKLSDIVTDIESSVGIEIGSETDDKIYFPPVLKEGEEMLKERVKIYTEDGQDIDLEDVLRFAAKYCRGIYDRVGDEVPDKA